MDRYIAAVCSAAAAAADRVVAVDDGACADHQLMLVGRTTTTASNPSAHAVDCCSPPEIRMQQKDYVSGTAPTTYKSAIQPVLGPHDPTASLQYLY